MIIEVIAAGGQDLPAYGHRARGETFDIPDELAQLLLVAAPQIFGEFEVTVEEVKDGDV